MNIRKNWLLKSTIQTLKLTIWINQNTKIANFYRQLTVFRKWKKLHKTIKLHEQKLNLIS